MGRDSFSNGSREGNIREAVGVEPRPFDAPLVADARGYGVGTVPIDLIDDFEANPRFLPNAKYEDIKLSIAKVGYDGLLPVTQRPGSERYVVARGGNTSLRAYRELRDEAADDRFERIPVFLQPYRDEMALLDGHDRENNVRSGISFGERAHEVRQKRIEFERLNGPASDAQFLSAEEARGFKIDARDYRRMRFWTEEVAPYLPGIHRTIPIPYRIVRDLMSFKRTVEEVWFEHDFGPEDRAESAALFEATFQGVLAKFDAIVIEDGLEQVDLPALKSMIYDEMKMSDLGGKEVFSAEMVEAAARARASAPERPTPTFDPSAAASSTPPVQRSLASILEPGEVSSGAGHETSNATAEALVATTPSVTSTDHLPAPLGDDASASVPCRPQAPSAASVRAEAFQLARDLAERHRFGELVRATDRATGFYLTEFPSNFSSATSLKRPAALWYVLFSLSDPWAYSDEERLALIDRDSNLNDAFRHHDGLQFVPAAIPYEQNTFGFVQSFRELDERDRPKVFRLLELSIRLRQFPHDLTNPMEGREHD